MHVPCGAAIENRSYDNGEGSHLPAIHLIILWAHTSESQKKRKAAIGMMSACMQAKWGELRDPTMPCDMEVVSALTGAKTLPQQPFGNYERLQKGNWLNNTSIKKYGVPTLKGVEMRDPPNMQD